MTSEPGIRAQAAAEIIQHLHDKADQIRSDPGGYLAAMFNASQLERAASVVRDLVETWPAPQPEPERDHRVHIHAEGGSIAAMHVGGAVVEGDGHRIVITPG